MRRLSALTFCLLFTAPAFAGHHSGHHSGHRGYYRAPAVAGDTIVFTAEGDLWTVSIDGGVARRLTTHEAEEIDAALSPDGATVAFVAHYEGAAEVYTMPVTGGVPKRHTWGADRAHVCGWTSDGDLLYASRHHSTLPSVQLIRLDPVTNREARVPLAEAADGALGADGTLVFTRLPFQGSHTKRYKGGYARNLWRFSPGDIEATPLTGDYAGESHEPMWWGDRVCFVSDRDGTMNLWSMRTDGTDLQQHTTHAGFDVTSPTIAGDRVVYQLGADLVRHDLARNESVTLDITLASDLDQMSVRWLDDPMEYVTASDLAADGSRVTLTARGELFVIPRKSGRRIHVAPASNTRYRFGRFGGEADTLYALSDATGEVELAEMPADGTGAVHPAHGERTDPPVRPRRQPGRWARDLPGQGPRAECLRSRVRRGLRDRDRTP